MEEKGKICRSCGYWKPFNDYTSYPKINKAGEEVTYYYSKCKDCVNASYRANYTKLRPTKRGKVDYRKIGKVQQEAAEHGMSYGKWVAHLEYEKQKEEKNKWKNN